MGKIHAGGGEELRRGLANRQGQLTTPARSKPETSSVRYEVPMPFGTVENLVTSFLLLKVTVA